MHTHANTHGCIKAGLEKDYSSIHNWNVDCKKEKKVTKKRKK